MTADTTQSPAPELLEYIKGQTAQGMQVTDIQAALQSQGWPDAVVAQALQQLGLSAGPVSDTAQPAAVTLAPSPHWRRLLASIVDSLLVVFGGTIIFLIPLYYMMPGVQLTQFFGDMTTTVFIFGLTATFFVYRLLYLMKTSSTFGKKKYGLKVVMYGTGADVTTQKAAIREGVYAAYAIPVVGSIASIVSCFMILFSKEHRGVHDLVAGTQVVKV